MTLTARSLKNLETVHPVLVRLVHRVAQIAPPFTITEGRRSKERQAQLVRAGKSKTMNSRHITGHAVDFVALVDGDVSWDAAHMRPVADAFATAAAEMDIKITRGIDWGWDSPHIELDRKGYPNSVTESPNSGSHKPISDSVGQISDSAPAPMNPLPKSGTVWGSVAGAVAAISAYFEQAAAGLIEWAAKLSEIGPAQAALASMGGNIKSMTLGLGVGAALYVISRRVKAQQEGKRG